MEKHEQLLKNYLLNKTINDIEFFDTDLIYVSPDMEHTWIVDGGIQFKIDNDYFSFAFTTEQEFFNTFSLKVEELNNDFPLESLEAKNLEQVNSIIGTKITDVKAIWNFYNELDENFEEIAEKKYMPFEIILYLDNKSFMQIAVVDYVMENNSLKDLRYDSERELLISVNKKFEIVNANYNMGS